MSEYDKNLRRSEYDKRRAYAEYLICIFRIPKDKYFGFTMEGELIKCGDTELHLLKKLAGIDKDITIWRSGYNYIHRV